MSHLATLRDYRFHNSSEDIRGFSLFGESGKQIASVNDVVLDHEGGTIQFVVADSGHNRNVLIPLNRLSRSLTHDRAFSSNLAASDLDRLPIFNPAMLNSDNWDDYERLLHSALEDVADARRESRVKPARENVLSINRGARSQISSDAFPSLGPTFRGFQESVRRELQHIKNECGDCDKRRRIA
ncbi:MAG TPA: PRC-barrel domain-containing protein [Terriglobales bacterium]|nr:PRC-barrel domain-containing protein [Terriglobales bacterium]